MSQATLFDLLSTLGALVIVAIAVILSLADDEPDEGRPDSHWEPRA